MFGISIRIYTDENGEQQFAVGNNTTEKIIRKNKGKCANKHVDDYCLIDLETTDRIVSCARIIEIAALRVRNGQVVAQYNTLVNPQCKIPEEATEVNHITDDMVKDQPILDDVIDDFLNFVGDDVVIGYNQTGFDMNIIYDDVLILRDQYFTNNYLDVYQAVRRALPDLKPKSLESVSKYYGIDTTGEHRALNDCILTKKCYDRLYEDFGEEVLKNKDKHSYIPSGNGKRLSPETLALRELKEASENLLKNKTITWDEVDELSGCLEGHRDFSDKYPFNKVYDSLDVLMEYGTITSEAFDELRKILSVIVNPIEEYAYHGLIDTIDGIHICITGGFDYGKDAEVQSLIESAGGIFDKSFKKTTTKYVVVGAKGSPFWAAGDYGKKINYASEAIDQGKDIIIVKEHEFIPIIEKMVK